MRKIINVCVIGAVLFGLYLAFTFKEPRNGILMLGDKQALQEIKNEHKSEIKSVDLYKVKTAENDGKSVFIMDQHTAESVIKKGVLREGEDRDISVSDSIHSLPKMTNSEAVLFADKKNENLKKVVVADKEIPVRYDSNTWFGHTRDSKYEELILIVNDYTFNQIPVKETYMGIFKLNKVYGNNHGIVDTNNAKSVQTEKEFTKLIKSKTAGTQFLEGLSIIK
ncbi:lipoprotein BA_5634 family protein [Brevibacillus daliensis]|uniref:lipoprotein BA_5634 family protein n=1 Tax=Brevibacillus daliensis TaxID=2892995 RepID=UPI001E5CE0B7|nr:lipoprotein BA_5634 family protein [Brevibacillus daliensis]